MYIESMPFTTSISVLEWPWNSVTPTLELEKGTVTLAFLLGASG